jgi:hypothetical protein
LNNPREAIDLGADLAQFLVHWLSPRLAFAIFSLRQRGCGWVLAVRLWRSVQQAPQSALHPLGRFVAQRFSKVSYRGVAALAAVASLIAHSREDSMEGTTDPKSLVFTREYAQLTGLFQGSWASLELITDYAIWKFFGVTAEQAHLITSGMMFGRKARLLVDLIRRSDHKDKDKILAPFNELRGMSLRDVFAHSYVKSDRDTVTYLERLPGGDFRAKEHVFTLSKFSLHVLKFISLSDAFYNALGVSRAEIEEFGNAALSLSRKSKRSPG